MAQPVDDFSDAALLEKPALPSPADITANLAPLTTNEVGRVFSTATPSLGLQQVRPEPTEAEQFQAENARPGVPLRTRGSEVDTEDRTFQGPGMMATGTVSPMFRFQMERRTSLKSQLKYAQSKLGEENARVSKDGKEIIVSIPNPDEPGKQMDVTVNDRDMTVSDFFALAAYVPEFAGAVVGLAAARMGRPQGAKGLLNFLKDSIGGAVGQETAGGLAEAGTRLQDLEPVNPGEITQNRVRQLPIDMGMDVLGVGVGKAIGSTARFIQAPFAGSRTALQNEGLEAAARLKTATGIDAKYTPGQASGFTALITGERYIKATPSGSSAMEQMFKQQEEDKKAIFDAISDAGTTDEEIGAKLIARLQASRDATETALQASRGSLEQTTGTRIKTSLKGVSASPELTPVQAGDKLRSEITGEHGVVMAERKRLYTEAYAVPGAKDPIVPTAGITKAIKEIKLPMRTVEKEVKDVDAYGNPIAKTTTKREPVSEFLHSEVEQFLGTKLDPKMPLQEVVQMRDMLWDEINRGEAVKGIPTKQLTQIGRSLTEAIDKGIADLPAGSQLKTKLGVANKFYKERVLKFEEAGIADIFKDVKDLGFKESSQIIERLASDPDKYLRTMKLLGSTSEGAKTIRAFIRDDLVRKSAYDFDPARMESKRFIANLRKLREDSPDIYKDVIGARGDNLLEDATLMGTAQGSIAVKDAQQALSGKQSIFQLDDMVRKQKDADQIELDQLMKAYTKGNLDVNTINPEQMVNGFIDVGTESQIRQLMDGIRADNPALGKQIERKMTEKLLADAGGLKATDTSIKELFSKPTEVAKYEAVLGPTQLSLVKDVAAYLGPIRYAEDVARGTGSLVKGSKIGAFFQSLTDMAKPLHEVGDILKFRMASLVVTNPLMRSWVLNTPSASHFDLVKAVVLSEPFIKSLGEDIADDGKLASVVSSIREMLTFGAPAGQPQEAPTAKIPADQF